MGLLDNVQAGGVVAAIGATIVAQEQPGAVETAVRGLLEAAAP
jgi:hypothetical protein